MTPPAGAPVWLVVVGMLLSLVAAGGGVTALVMVGVQRRRAKADTDEVFTRVAITLVQPLEQRLASAEQALADSEAEVDKLRGRVRAAHAEADEAWRAAYRLRTLVQQWHRAIMSPQATLDWLRELVGPSEPSL